ncbi:hypothetical protein ABZ814_19365 [Micromonospora musae]|uniref:hypothetical protein n=1 Tax=Micromonospora musae TaxID=1894970 RepID=UPI003408F696
MKPDELTALFERARTLSQQQHTWAEADRMWGEVIDAYRAALRSSGPVNRRDQQQLARALWRRGMLAAARGDLTASTTLGQEAVVAFAEVHDAVRREEPSATGPRRDEALAELIVALLDLGESAFAAGQPATRLALIGRALEVGLHTAGPPPGAGPKTREAMGTAYHNHANALVHRALTGDPTGDDAREAALAASRAVELRQALADPSRPLSMWELANTYAVYAQCLALIGDFDRARTVLQLGTELANLLGPAGVEIVAKLRVAADMVQLRQPEAADGERRRWGWRRR